MCVNRKNANKIKIVIDWVKVEQVDCFRYLGSLISSNGYCEKESHSNRIEMAKKIFHDKKKLVTSKLNLELKRES